ncbi:MAG: homoserine O-acetyltransferase [Sphingobacteriales bacterium]|nr:homoserine O-acetyltransferase [Sphingobacteriales bacterium]
MRFTYHQPLRLESGLTVPAYHLEYTTQGRLNEAGDNVVWIFHALTANSDASEWWPGLVGAGRLFDPSVYYIVCVNMPGSCYGSTGPEETDHRSGQPYYHDFPVWTTRDMIRAYQPLRESLGIRKIHVGIGGSMGGQQLLEWAIEEPELFRHIVPIATNGRHSPWGIAFNTSQRMAIEADPTWQERRAGAGAAGMRAARAVALLSYRDYGAYGQLQPRQEDQMAERVGTLYGQGTNGSRGASSYQRYQGEKLVRRFSAFSYYALSLSMDAHDVGRGRGGLVPALGRIKAKTLVIGIESDILFPVTEQRTVATLIPGASLRLIQSLYGHDGFLLEFEQIRRLVEGFLDEQPAPRKEQLINH